MGNKRKKDWSDDFEILSLHTFIIVTLPLRRTAAKSKQKFCLLSHNGILFLISLISFEFSSTKPLQKNLTIFLQFSKSGPMLCLGLRADVNLLPSYSQLPYNI